MADTPQTLDDLSEPQREALTWLSHQQGTDAVDPPSEYRTQTWTALARHGLVVRDDDGNISMRPAGRAMFAADENPATAEAPAEVASSDPASSDPASSGGVGVTVEQGTGSPSAEEFAADSQPAPQADSSSPPMESGAGVPPNPEMAGTVEPSTGEDPNPAPAPGTSAGTPVHERAAATLGELRAGMRGVDPRLGAYRVLGEPEELYGTWAGKYRVPVMVVEDGRRDFVRGPLDQAIEQE